MRLKRKMDKRIFVFFIIIVLSLIVGYFLLKSETPINVYFKETETELKSRHSQNMKRVLIIHSYHREWGWDQDTENGIIEGLKKGGYKLDKDYTLKTFYMDTKNKYTTTEQIKMRAEQAMNIIDEYKPDIVFINDDNALKYVAVAYTLKNPDSRLPFVFSGINVDPSVYEPIDTLEKPGHSITGALERFPYYQSFSLAKRILPNRTRVVLFADSSPSSNFVVNSFEERYLEKVNNSPLDVVAVVQVKTFREWKEKIKEYQKKADFLGIITYHQLRDDDGNIVDASRVVLWTINNNKLPEIGFLLFHAEDGFWLAVGVSPYKTGRYVGTIGAEILNGKNPGEIPIVDPKLVDVAFNLERSKMLGIEIPIDILGMATEIYPKIKKPRY